MRNINRLFSFKEKWKPIATAPVDGKVFLLMKYHEEMPEFYSAWWCEEDWCLILNDDEKQEPLEGKSFDDYSDKWFWKSIKDIRIRRNAQH